MGFCRLQLFLLLIAFGLVGIATPVVGETDPEQFHTVLKISEHERLAIQTRVLEFSPGFRLLQDIACVSRDDGPCREVQVWSALNPRYRNPFFYDQVREDGGRLRFYYFTERTSPFRPIDDFVYIVATEWGEGGGPFRSLAAGRAARSEKKALMEEGYMALFYVSDATPEYLLSGSYAQIAFPTLGELTHDSAHPIQFESVRPLLFEGNAPGDAGEPYFRIWGSLDEHSAAATPVIRNIDPTSGNPIVTELVIQNVRFYGRDQEVSPPDGWVWFVTARNPFIEGSEEEPRYHLFVIRLLFRHSNRNFVGFQNLKVVVDYLDFGNHLPQWLDPRRRSLENTFVSDALDIEEEEMTKDHRLIAADPSWHLRPSPVAGSVQLKSFAMEGVAAERGSAGDGGGGILAAPGDREKRSY